MRFLVFFFVSKLYVVLYFKFVSIEIGQMCFKQQQKIILTIEKMIVLFRLSM